MSENNKLPNEELTEIIIEKLINEKIVSPNRSNALINLISQGNMKQEDWRACVELSLWGQEKEERTDE